MELESFISLNDVIDKGKNYFPKKNTMKIRVEDAVGKYSSEPIKSSEDFPNHDRSAMDGFAVHFSETISASHTNPATFRIVGRLYPSSETTGKISAGEAIAITTGALMPDGADAVAVVEESVASGNKLTLFSPVRKFQNISRKGEDLKKGTVILKKGQRINPPHLVALKEGGIKEINVWDISIGIISTGDELASGRVINSTQPFLDAYFKLKGLRAYSYGTVEDNLTKIKKAIDRVKEDIIVVTGGTGPGEIDLVPEFMKANGKIVFRGVKIRPGRTTGLGYYNSKPVFMISGLPVAALIACENVITKLIEKWFGLEEEMKVYVEGILKRSIVNPIGFRSFVRVKINEMGERNEVVPTRTTGSGVIYSVLESQGIMEIGENSEGKEEGSTVRVQLLRW